VIDVLGMFACYTLIQLTLENSLEYLRPRALMLLKTWRYISRLLTYLLTYLEQFIH